MTARPLPLLPPLTAVAHERHQAIVRIVPRGGVRTARQILDQWMYLCRGGELSLQGSERHMGIWLRTEELKELADSWVMETGTCRATRTAATATLPPAPAQADIPALTTHIIISFPPGTNVECSFRIGRAWAEEMFGSGQNGGTFDYITACHSDRPHPHVHLVVNRRALEGHWLKISRRHPQLNYTRIRSALVEVAGRHGVMLDATSRTDRGIAEAPLTYAEFRRRARAADSAPSPVPGAPR